MNPWIDVGLAITSLVGLIWLFGFEFPRLFRLFETMEAEAIRVKIEEESDE